MSTPREAWLRFALQDLIEMVVAEVPEPSHSLMKAIHRAKEALKVAERQEQHD